MRNRRDFLKTVAAAAAGVLVTGGSFSEAALQMPQAADVKRREVFVEKNNTCPPQKSGGLYKCRQHKRFCRALSVPCIPGPRGHALFKLSHHSVPQFLDFCVERG